jgi:hypothetical protein
MSDFAESLRVLRGSPGPSLGTDDFVARVMSACTAEPSAKGRRRRRLGAWTYGAAAVVAAAAAAAVALLPAPKEAGLAALDGHVAARGAGLPSHAATVQAFVARGQPGVAPALLEGAELGPGDGILVRYSNPTDRTAYLMVFALDQRGDVHWIHPAYLDVHDSPSSLGLQPRSSLRVLDEVAEPEDPAPGPLRVFALLSDAPLRVKDVEAKLSTQQLPVRELFSQAEVEEWRCTWRAR